MAAPARNRADPVDEKRVMTALRVLPSELAEIDRRAKSAGTSRTDYILRRALHIPVGDEDYDEQLLDHERRLYRLEQRLFEGA